VLLAARDPGLSAARREETARGYADRAVALLREAVAQGYRDAAALHKDARLDALRSRDDFRRLLAELAGTGQVPPG
jgi:hypothetical protein